MRGYFVTGTDTGVGKTLAAAALVHAARARGLRAAGMKPVASGGARGAGGAWRNEDALALQAAAGAPEPPYAWVNPYALPEPTAPQIAARLAGIDIDFGTIETAFAALATDRDVVVVEGVGGWMAPFADGLEHADVARGLGLDVLLVVGLRLGCLSHARLTARAVRADGLRLAGWIGNAVDPAFGHVAEYRRLLADALDCPCVGQLPHAPGAEPAALAIQLQGFAFD